MNNPWDVRFSNKKYHYGKTPNKYLKGEIDLLPPGNILLPAEGEGRNAVYASKKGWNVVAFDNSIEAKKKSEKLAKENNVQIEYHHKSYDDFNFKLNFFDCIGLIFAHVPPNARNSIHNNLLKFLKPGGTIILQGFSKEQINYNSGGPKNIDMLFSVEELKEDFKSLKSLFIYEEIIELNEGDNHKGNAAVINLKGIK